MPIPASLKPPKKADFAGECVAFFSEVVQVVGVPKSIGQIYGLLFSSPEPLSFSDIVVRLKISKGSASQGLQLLRTLGAIKIVPSDPRPKRQASELARRDYFEPELGLRRLISGVLRERFDPMVARGAIRLERLRRLGEENRDNRIFRLKRIEQLETWRFKLKLTLPVLRTILGPKDN